MRNSIQVFIVASLLALSGCPDKEKHASIEAMNEGIKAAQLNSYTAAIKHLKKAEEEFKKGFRCGASGVMTDYPSRLAEFLRQNPEYNKSD